MIGGVPTGSRDRFDTDSPLYQSISRARPRSATGTRRWPTAPRCTATRPTRPASTPSAGSSRDKKPVEYLVVANNSTEPKTADLATWSRDDRLKPLYGRRQPAAHRRRGAVTVTRAAAVGAGVEGDRQRRRHEEGARGAPHLAVATARWSAAAPRSRRPCPRTPSRRCPSPTARWARRTGRASAPTTTRRTASSTTSATWPTGRCWSTAPCSRTRGAGCPRAAATAWSATRRRWRGGGGGGVEPVEQPAGVAVPGDHNSEMGCPGDWQPDCAQAQLALDDDDEIWKGEFDLPAGVVCLQGGDRTATGTRTTAPGGAPNGGNIAYTAPGTPVTFYYEHSHALRHVRRRAPDHDAGGQPPVRARVLRRLGAGLHARLADRPGRRRRGHLRHLASCPPAATR